MSCLSREIETTKALTAQSQKIGEFKEWPTEWTQYRWTSSTGKPAFDDQLVPVKEWMINDDD